MSLPGVNLLDEKQVAARSSIFGDIYEHDVSDIARPAASLRFRWVIEASGSSSRRILSGSRTE